MSKSLGNSPDPIELIHKYGADGVRVGILISSPQEMIFHLILLNVARGRNLQQHGMRLDWYPIGMLEIWSNQNRP